MNPYNSRLLLERYPLIYREWIEPAVVGGDVRMFECGDGWFTLLDAVSAKLERHAMARAAASSEPLKVIQVKEKFGALRVYLADADDEAYAYVDEVEIASRQVCDQCGRPGRLSCSGAVCSRCAEHATSL